MTEMQLDPRAATWLDLGPNRAPADSFDAIMAVVDVAPQRKPRLRLGGRPVAFSPRLLAAAAAIVIAVSAVGGYVLRDPILDVLAPPPGDLLAAFPETRLILEASGGPAIADETVVVGRLPKDARFIIAATCDGGDDAPVVVEIWDREIEYGPDVPEEDRQPQRRLEVPCDGSIATTAYVVDQFSSDRVELTVASPARTTWRVAAGQVRGTFEEPAFPALGATEGTVMMMDLEPTLVYGHPGLGIGLQPPPSGELVTLTVRCFGDPVTVTNDTGVPPVELACKDAADTRRIGMPVPSGGSAWAGTDGFAWVRMAVEAPIGPADGGRPEAPAMPAAIADIAFAEGDGQNVVFGTLGSNRQQLVRAPDSLVGTAGGDVVAISRADGDDAVLELWSMRDAAPLRTLARITGGRVFGSWVDATHQQVFYGVQGPLGSFEWRRVGFDSSGDAVIASGSIGLRFAQAAMAVDDAHFVTQWCPIVGSCERVVYDTATGDLRTVAAADEICTLLGVIGGRLVASTASSCDTGEDAAVVAQPVDGGAWTTLFDGHGDITLVAGEDGPLAVRLQPADTRSTLSAVALDGTGARDVATFEHESGMEPVLSRVRLPEPGWVLLAGLLGEIAGGVSIGGGGPTLVRLDTGERIELVNLPGF